MMKRTNNKRIRHVRVILLSCSLLIERASTFQLHHGHSRPTSASLSLRSYVLEPKQVTRLRFWRSNEAETIVDESKGWETESSGLPRQTPTSDLTESSSNGFSGIVSQAELLLTPAANILDDVTDGYAMTYADLTPETQDTPIGQAFLASNVAYAAAGFVLASQGDVLLGFLTELVSVASFVYHYTQLDPASKNNTVRLALLIDYTLAFTSIFVGLGYILADGQLPPLDGIVSGSLGMVFFILGCTTCATGTPYVVVHSIWHLLSAYCAYVIGNSHVLMSIGV